MAGQCCFRKSLMPTTVIPSTPGLPLLALTCRNAAFRFSRSHTASINRFVLAGFSVPLIAPDDSVSSLPASRASPVSAEEKSSSIWVFCCLSSLRLMAYWPLLLVRAFGHRFRLGLSIAPPFGIRSASLALPTSRPNMPSADSAPRSSRLSTASVAEATRSRSPGVSTAAFHAQSPNLRFAPLMDMGFAVSRPLVRHRRLISGSCPSTRTFAPRFFRTSPRDDSPCVITSPSPPSGWAGDFHPQAAEHAQHTTKPLRGKVSRSASSVCQGNCNGSDPAVKWPNSSPVWSRCPKQNWLIPFNAQQAIALPNLPGLVQSIFGPPPRRSASSRSSNLGPPRRRAKNALHYVVGKLGGALWDG